MDLFNLANWNKIASWDLRASNLFYTASGKPKLIKGLTDIEPVGAILETPVALIRTFAPESEIKPDWYRACWFTAYLSFVPGARDKVFQQECGLNEGTYLRLPNFGVYPYQVQITVPWYLVSLKIELWQFTDQSG